MTRALLLSVALLFSCAIAAEEPNVLKDIEYAKVEGHSLLLDLHKTKAPHSPLIVWVHGGAWRGGSKSDMPLNTLVDAGYAVASVDYRLSPVAPFPAQVHDIKAAIRFLRSKARDYGYDATRIAIAGASAGGHLAALVGVSNGQKDLEGKVGDHLDQSSDVHATISLFGASNLMTILSQSKPQGLKMRVPALQLLLGGQPDEKPDLAKLASPVTHVDAQDPPLLLIHGDADPQMPPEQSHELAAACRAAGARVQLVIIPGALHGGKPFFDDERFALMKTFLDASPK